MTESVQPLTEDEMRRRVEAAYQVVYALAKSGGRSHRMTVPPEPTDTDMTLIAGLDVAEQLLAARAEAPRAEHEPGEPHQYRVECKVCGQPGSVVLSIEPQRASDNAALTEHPPQPVPALTTLEREHLSRDDADEVGYGYKDAPSERDVVSEERP